MKTKHFIFLILPFLISISLNSCFPTYKANLVNLDSLSIGTHIEIQSKLFTSGNTIILFPTGFEYGENYIGGEGQIFTFPSKFSEKKTIKIPKDSIIAMITYEETTSATRYFGSFLLGLTAPPLTFLGIYCLSCPKCCFGSCPTIYAFDGENYNLEAELFSECISKQLENYDLDLIRQKTINDTLKIKITNEALETHYINKFEIVSAIHPKGTEVLPTIEDKLLVIDNQIPPVVVKNKESKEVTHFLINDDNQYYRSGVEKITELRKGPVFDYLDFELPQNATKMLMKYRNTLLSTTLLYNVVIGSQGIKGLEWTKKMNEDPIYASQFKMIYEMFSGIKIKLKQNGDWKEVGYFKDAGPLNWKYIAAELKFDNAEKNILRLEFIPDNFMIDYVSFDTTKINCNQIKTKAIYPSVVLDNRGKKNGEIMSFLIENDSNYLVTEPGDFYSLNYYSPKIEENEQTFFIKSKGYYNEWIRGIWISENNSNYTFNLYNIQETLNSLVDSWLENYELLENEFFNSRINLKGEK